MRSGAASFGPEMSGQLVRPTGAESVGSVARKGEKRGLTAVSEEARDARRSKAVFFAALRAPVEAVLAIRFPPASQTSLVNVSRLNMRYPEIPAANWQERGRQRGNMNTRGGCTYGSATSTRSDQSAILVVSRSEADPARAVVV